MSFHLVQYSQLFDPVAHTEVIVSDDFDQWKAWRERCGDLFSYCKEISMKDAQKSAYRCNVRIACMEEE